MRVECNNKNIFIDDRHKNGIIKLSQLLTTFHIFFKRIGRIESSRIENFSNSFLCVSIVQCVIDCGLKQLYLF